MSSITGAPPCTNGGIVTEPVLYTEVPNYISLHKASQLTIDSGGAIGIKLNSFLNNQGMIINDDSIIIIRGV